MPKLKRGAITRNKRIERARKSFPVRDYYKKKARKNKFA